MPLIRYLPCFASTITTSFTAPLTTPYCSIRPSDYGSMPWAILARPPFWPRLGRLSNNTTIYPPSTKCSPPATTSLLHWACPAREKPTLRPAINPAQKLPRPGATPPYITPAKQRAGINWLIKAKVLRGRNIKNITGHSANVHWPGTRLSLIAHRRWKNLSKRI